MNNTNKDIIRNGEFDFYKKGLIYGLVGGVLMSILTVFTAGNGTIADSFLKYLVFLPFLYYGLHELKSTYVKGPYVKEGILFGMYTSAVAGAGLALSGLLLIFAGLKAAEKFSYDAHSVVDLVAFQFISFFEVMGLGMILTMICLQFLKFTGINEDANNTVDA